MVAAAAVVLALIGTPRSANAVAAFLAAVPEPGSTYQGNPPLINARYSERLDPAGSLLELVGPDKVTVKRGGVTADGSYPTEMWIEGLPTLTPGLYTVRSRATSALDGVARSFEWTFTVEPIPPGGTPEPLPICTDGCNGFSTDARPTSAPSASIASPVALPVASGAHAPPAAVSGGSTLLVAAVLAIAASVVITLARRRDH